MHAAGYRFKKRGKRSLSTVTKKHEQLLMVHRPVSHQEKYLDDETHAHRSMIQMKLDEAGEGVTRLQIN